MAIMEKIGDTAESVIDFKVFIFERTSWVCFSDMTILPFF